jgi:hypothetical protein
MVLFRRFSIVLTIQSFKKLTMSRMIFMRSWKTHRLTHMHGLGLNPQIARPLSRIVVPLVYFFYGRLLRSPWYFPHWHNGQLTPDSLQEWFITKWLIADKFIAQSMYHRVGSSQNRLLDFSKTFQWRLTAKKWIKFSNADKKFNFKLSFQ